MKRFYLTGQRTFENRGCEAIVRSTVGLLIERFGDIEVLVPSDDINRDKKQWPEAAGYGVEFVPAYMPKYTRYWVNLQRLPFPFLKRAGWPFPMPSWLRSQIASVDAVLAIGGDNYSLDYRIPSLSMGLDRFAMDMGKPVILWGASVGPFEREPHFVSAIRQHLSRMNLIAVRESYSYQYLTENLGLQNVMKMADPAFTLSKQSVDLKEFWPTDSAGGVLGLNISPLIERYAKKGQELRQEAEQFIRHVVSEKKMSVLLVPHVMSFDSSKSNCDHDYMLDLLNQLKDLGPNVKMIPQQFNASEIKYIISQLRFFIGARTHATIAALSSGVPTVSIAYSVKAKGINKDIFGNEDPLLETASVSAQSLQKSFEWLLNNENSLVDTLKKRVPELQTQVRQAMASIQK